MLQTEYIAAGANRHPSAADWYGPGGGGDGLLAFGSGRNIAVWRPEVRGLIFFFFFFLLCFLEVKTFFFGREGFMGAWDWILGCGV